jgi:hypothetical protein
LVHTSVQATAGCRSAHQDVCCEEMNFWSGAEQVLLKGSYVAPQRTANLESLAEFGMVPIANVEFCNAYVADAAFAGTGELPLFDSPTLPSAGRRTHLD